MIELLAAKPVLIGLHLGFAILGIDAFFWVLGELVSGAKHAGRLAWAAWLGLGAFLASWLVGGYYYVTVYGALVKPAIKAGLAPWAHSLVMETKEHIFLFLIPLAVTMVSLVIARHRLLTTDRRLMAEARWLAGSIVGLGLLVGLLGFIVSAAARWGGGA